MRHIFRAREAGAVVVSRERRGFLFWIKEVVFVETRVALMGIIVEEPERAAEIAKLEQEMKEASKLLEFEYAAVLRDRIIELRGGK